MSSTRHESRKATVTSPSNIAFIKYWGARDLEKALPENPSLSMTLRVCHSRSTIEHLEEEGEHEIRWRGTAGTLEDAPPAFAGRVSAHLDRLRLWAGCGGRFRVATENSFPAAAGLASSASGFSALTLGVLGALGREESPAMQSHLARLSGSGSASRSVLGGYVRWPADDGEPDGELDGEPDAEAGSYAVSIASAEHWDLRDVIAVVESGPKDVSSLDGHRRARTSPYFEHRLEQLPARFEQVQQAILERDFDVLGPAIETEAIDLHMIAMTSKPPIFYWQPATLAVLAAVRDLRRDGIAAWSTMDAGANVHVICQPRDEPDVAARLAEVGGVESVLRDGVGSGPQFQTEHLF